MMSVFSLIDGIKNMEEALKCEVWYEYFVLTLLALPSFNYYLLHDNLLCIMVHLCASRFTVNNELFNLLLKNQGCPVSVLKKKVPNKI